MLGKKTGYVKDRAFYNDSNIENFQVKSDLYEVGFECFWNCKKMTEIQLGKNWKLLDIVHFQDQE